MKRLLIFILLLNLGCTQNAEKPKDLVDEDKMAEILSEIYLYQQSSYLTELKNEKPEYAKIDKKLIESRGITVHSFEQSYRYYVLIPDKYNEILRKTREILENKLPEKEREKRIDEREKSEKKK